MIFPVFTLPVTVNVVNVPTLVIFGCALVVNVPVSKLAPIVPLLAYTLPPVMLPVIVKLVSVPTLVIFGCAFVYTVPAIKLLAT